MLESRGLDAVRYRVPADQVAPRVISAENAWLMDNMMAEVITRGTGRRAMALGRTDLGGKTGTTNDAKDTWFNGFNRDLVASVWVGYDQERSLGEGEEGARTAVPIWVHFMREALRGVPQRSRPMPSGLVQVRISASTGALAGVDDGTHVDQAPAQRTRHDVEDGVERIGRESDARGAPAPRHRGSTAAVDGEADVVERVMVEPEVREEGRRVGGGVAQERGEVGGTRHFLDAGRHAGDVRLEVLLDLGFETAEALIVRRAQARAFVDSPAE